MTAEPMRFVVIGDATLDITVLGSDAAVAGADRPASIVAGPGGQGANVAVRLARGGATVRLVTAFADDGAGMVLGGALEADGVAVTRLPATRTGIVVALIDRAGERAMLSDRVGFDGEALEGAAVRGALDGAAWVHVSGYPLADDRSGEWLAGLVAARPAGVRCSVGGGSFVADGGLRRRVAATRPDLLLFDRAEASAVLADERGSISPDASAAELARRLATTFGAVAVVTDGAAGASAASPAGAVDVVGPPGPVLDATGAGDAHAAAVLLALAGGLADGRWPPTADHLDDALGRANRLGAEVAGVVGAQARVAREGGS